MGLFQGCGGGGGGWPFRFFYVVVGRIWQPWRKKAIKCQTREQEEERGEPLLFRFSPLSLPSPFSSSNPRPQTTDNCAVVYLHFEVAPRSLEVMAEPGETLRRRPPPEEGGDSASMEAVRQPTVVHTSRLVAVSKKKLEDYYKVAQ